MCMCSIILYIQKGDWIKLIISSTEMDPRPYHFDYRRPRLNNPTYESLKLYESIYQLDSFKRNNPQLAKRTHYQLPLQKPSIRQQPEQQRSTPQSQPQSMKRYQSFDNYQANKIYGNNRYENRTRTPKKDSDRLNSSLSQYGNTLVNDFTNMQRLDQNRVYQKQEKEFNIISYQPKNYKPSLKNYPRLTLEDRLIQRRGQTDKTE